MLMMLPLKALAECTNIKEDLLNKVILENFKEDMDFHITESEIFLTEEGLYKLIDLSEYHKEDLSKAIGLFVKPIEPIVGTEEQALKIHPYNEEITFIVNDQEETLFISTREVAKNMKKQHSELLKRIHGYNRNNTHINGIIDDMQSGVNTLEYFIPSEYVDTSGKVNKEYLLTKDGLALLVMGMTGAKAIEWKVKYIEAFNKMEKLIRSNHVIAINELPPITKALLALEQQQIELSQKLELTNLKLDNLTQCLALDKSCSKAEINKLVNRIVAVSGLSHQEFKRKSYAILQEQERVRLEVRLANLKKRMIDKGGSVTESNKLSKLDVIVSDSRLFNSYKNILAKMFANYGLEY